MPLPPTRRQLLTRIGVAAGTIRYAVSVDWLTGRISVDPAP